MKKLEESSRMSFMCCLIVREESWVIPASKFSLEKQNELWRDSNINMSVISIKTDIHFKFGKDVTKTLPTLPCRRIFLYTSLWQADQLYGSQKSDKTVKTRQCWSKMNQEFFTVFPNYFKKCVENFSEQAAIYFAIYLAWKRSKNHPNLHVWLSTTAQVLF